MTSVPRHWIVAGYAPPEDPTDPTDHGVLSAPTSIGYGSDAASTHGGGTVFFTLVDAQNAARTLAAASPGFVFVVYEAEWWAQVNLTPVALYPVGLTAVSP